MNNQKDELKFKEYVSTAKVSQRKVVSKRKKEEDKKMTPVQKLACGLLFAGLAVGIGVTGTNDFQAEVAYTKEDTGVNNNAVAPIEEDFFSQENIENLVKSVASEYDETISVMTEQRENEVITSYNDFKDKYITKDIDYNNQQAKIMAADDLLKKDIFLYDVQLAEYESKANSLDKNSDEYGILLEEIEELKADRQDIKDKMVYVLNGYADEGIITFGTEEKSNQL